jgi:predicted nucleic acid-binding protein
MFLLDTNVLSAMMDKVPPPVAAWLAGTPERFVYTASICQAEILAGITTLPDGRRRRGLETTARAMFDEDFIGKIWPLDNEAAEAYAEIFAIRRNAGRPTRPPDLMIAAIALSRDAAVVTRNVGDFDGCGVAVVNPWNER